MKITQKVFFLISLYVQFQEAITIKITMLLKSIKSN